MYKYYLISLVFSSLNEALIMDSSYDIIHEEHLDIFREPSRVIIAGYSNSGKSYLCSKLVRKYQHKFSSIIICGGGYSELRSDPQIKRKLIEHSTIIDPVEERVDNDSHILVIYDDLFTESANSKIVSDMFTRGRHFMVSVILITQNIFFPGKYSRNISLNASHFILVKSRDLSQIETLGRQIFGKQDSKKFVELYKKVISQPYGYLLVDLGSNTPSTITLRGNIVHEPPYEIVYQW